MHKKIKIAFICHDSSLTGAPILLLNLLHLLKDQDKYETYVVLARGGTLESEFTKNFSVNILKPANYPLQKTFLKKTWYYFKYRFRRYYALQRIKKANVVFNNTIANGKILQYISKHKIPIVSYIHELESVFKYFNKEGSSDFTLKCSSLLVCPSNAVAINLIKNHAVQENIIEYLPYYFKPTLAINTTADEYKKNLFAKNEIPDGKFYVVGMGSATLRKGIDLFLETCKKTIHKDPNICFIWLGDFEEETMQQFIFDKLNDSALKNSFFITGKIPPANYNLSPFDLFFLSSREDPYPLVVLEAALLKIPSVYFKESGGIQEFIGEDAGWPIIEFNTTSASNKILELKNNRTEIFKKGNRAFEKVKLFHTNDKLILSKFDSIINKVISRN